MNIFSSILITIIIITFPVLLYLFFVAHNQNYNSKIKDIWLDITLYTSMYLFLKFDFIFIHSTIMIVNVPLILAYVLKKRWIGFILGIVTILYIYTNSDINIYFLIAEYLIYFFLSFVKIKETSYINIFTLIKVLLLLLYNIFIKDGISYYNFIFMIAMYVASSLSFLIIKMSDDIMDYHMNIKALEEGKELKKTIFNITHEIKNPLSVCKGYLDMMDTSPSKSEDYIPIIKREIDKSLIILQDFMNINKIKVTTELMDINMFLEEEKINITNLVLSKEGKIEFDLLDDDIYIYGDYNRLNQVIVNLVKNGIEACKENPLIKIKTTIEQEFVILVIEDNGVGICKDDLEKIKKPFYTTKKSGTGLGLSLCNEIIEAHNGKLTYTSVIGKGTQAIITIPIIKETY